jgi:hypothetical protein
MNELSRMEEESVVRTMKPVVPGSFKEMFASHVLYILAYPQLTYVVGICVLQTNPPIKFMLNKGNYSAFIDVSREMLDFLISTVTVITRESAHESVTGWERYAFIKGSFKMFNITSVFNPKYRRLSRYTMNVWGVKNASVDMLLGRIRNVRHIRDYLIK